MSKTSRAFQISVGISRRISERALRKVLESADMKYRQMDMEKPKAGILGMILLMADILHQVVGSLSHYLQGFIHPRLLFGISEPSTVLGLNICGPPIKTTPPNQK